MFSLVWLKSDEEEEASWVAFSAAAICSSDIETGAGGGLKGRHSFASSSIADFRSVKYLI